MKFHRNPPRIEKKDARNRSEQYCMQPTILHIISTLVFVREGKLALKFVVFLVMIRCVNATPLLSIHNSTTRGLQGNGS